LAWDRRRRVALLKENEPWSFLVPCAFVSGSDSAVDAQS
jgi:hypothetical protein